MHMDHYNLAWTILFSFHKLSNLNLRLQINKVKYHIPSKDYDSTNIIIYKYDKFQLLNISYQNIGGIVTCGKDMIVNLKTRLVIKIIMDFVVTPSILYSYHYHIDSDKGSQKIVDF